MERTSPSHSKEVGLQPSRAHDLTLVKVSRDQEKTMVSRNESDTEVGEKKGHEGGSTTADEGERDGEAEDEFITGVKLWLVLGALTGTTFLMLLDMSIITTASNISNDTEDLGRVLFPTNTIPNTRPSLKSPPRSTPSPTWAGTAPRTTSPGKQTPSTLQPFNSFSRLHTIPQPNSAALQPFAGKLYTHLRSKWTYLVFLFLFELGSLICGVATSSNMLIVGRAVAGMGSAGLYNGMLTIIANTVPLARRPLIIGIIIGLANMGLVTGPLVGGALTEYSTWRWCG